MSQVTRRGPVKPNLNITPLIDVVFLLIVFFMLVSKIVTDEVPEVQLPDLDEPEARRVENDNRLIISIVPVDRRKEGDVGPDVPVGEAINRSGDAEFVTMGSKKWVIGNSEDMTDFREYIATSMAARLTGKGRPLVFLRCDSAIFYSEAIKVLDMLQLGIVEGYDKAGMNIADHPGATQIEIVAYAPPKE